MADVSIVHSPTINTVAQIDRLGARNYDPIPVVIASASGAWVKDIEGKSYLDMLSAYSALNHGHRHPRIIETLKRQADKLTLTSRAFHHDVMLGFYERVSRWTNKNKILPMNTGAEAVETAIKAARRWGYRVKGIPDDQAEIIVCAQNFHGRTITITSFSTNPVSRAHFGPFTPGFRVVPYGDLNALEEAIHDRTAAFLVEPIQGEAGVIIPPDGYIKQAREICRKHQVLFIADEIQTGLCRTGRRFACDWEQVEPDLYIIGKALGGGVIPISAVAGDEEVMDLFDPGSHGSTFGGNPLACAVASTALDVLEEEQLDKQAERKGKRFLEFLKQLQSPVVKAVRGRGLLLAVDLTVPARPFCEKLMQNGILCKETHEHTIRFAPPLIIEEQDLEWAMQRIQETLK